MQKSQKLRADFKYVQGGFFNWSAQKMTKCQITCKSLQKSSKCQNFQRVWHLVIFWADQLKKPPCKLLTHCTLTVNLGAFVLIKNRTCTRYWLIIMIPLQERKIYLLLGFQEFLNLFPNSFQSISWNLILLCQVNWDDQLHTLPQGAGLPPPPHHQPQYPLQDHQPLCPPTDCQPQKNQWEPFCSDQGNACEERQSSMSQSLSPESPEISFLQPSFLSPTYQRPKNVAHGL